MTKEEMAKAYAEGFSEEYREIAYDAFLCGYGAKCTTETPKDLEEAAKNYAELLPQGRVSKKYSAIDFIFGAKWQESHAPLPEDTVLFNNGVEEGKRLMMEEFEGNRLAACDSQTKEEYDRETDFVDSIIKKEHRQPTFSDAINYGMRLQKEQMMKEAVEGQIVSRNDDWNSIELPSTFFGELSKNYKHGDKVRIIIIKEDER